MYNVRSRFYQWHKWPSHYTIYHKKLSNAGLVSAVGIVWEPHVRFTESNTFFHQLPVTGDFFHLFPVIGEMMSTEYW